MTQHTLEQYFKLHEGKAVDFSLRIENRDGGWLFYIHPQNVDGETWDFRVYGNVLRCIQPGSSEVGTESTLLDNEILFQMLKHLNAKISELETVNTSQRDQLFKRVEELEAFQRQYETAQEYERDRS
jgi:hypothetical protein